MLKLYFELVKSLSLIIVIGYLISQNSGMQIFLKNKKQNIPNEIVLGILFGVLAILGTYFGKPYKGGIANIRDTSVIISGLFAGPLTGSIAGLIGGIHRLSLGGATAMPCGFATMINGAIAGFFHYIRHDDSFGVFQGILLTAALESFHILMVIIFTHPRSLGIDIARYLYGPMLTINSLGVGLFLYMLKMNLSMAHKETALTAQRVLNIASKTFPILSKEPTERAFQLTADLILENTNLDSVVFADKKHVLGISGKLSKTFKKDIFVQDPVIIKALQTGKAYKYYYDKYSALVVPLKNSSGETMAALVMYRKNKNTITDLDIKLARGMSIILSTQTELKEIEKEKTLRLISQFNELQSRINPHFLFNSLNTINYVLRTDAKKARLLILELSNLLRKAVEKKNELIFLEEEIEMAKSYLELEKARFQDKLCIKWNIQPEIYSLKVPPLIIQPIIENSIKHGFDALKERLTITISGFLKHKTYILTVEDNGRGMSKEKMKEILRFDKHSGLANVKNRLDTIFGYNSSFILKSIPLKGTKVEIRISERGLNGGWLSKQLLSMTRSQPERN